MMDRKAELFEEVSQLLTQYRQEVPGTRKAWPESIKSRVIDLRRSGLSFSEISRRTGIPYYTVLCWRDKKRSGFERVSIVAASKTATVTVPIRPTRRASKISDEREVTATVTVAIPGGIRIEGVSVEFLKALLPNLTGGGQ